MLLEEIGNQLRRKGIVYRLILGTGNPVDVVRSAIHDSGATRLLIGTHLHHTFGPLLLGSAANAFLRQSTIPVFTVGPLAHPPLLSAPKRFLHPISLHGNYQASSVFALRLAQASKAKLTFVHILDESVLASPYVETVFAKARLELDELAAPTCLQPPVHTVVRAGDLDLQILELSAKEGTDVIVMGIEHDLPWWSRRNTLTYQIIAGASCPVLVVRPVLLPADGTAMVTVPNDYGAYSPSQRG